MKYNLNIQKLLYDTFFIYFLFFINETMNLFVRFSPSPNFIVATGNPNGNWRTFKKKSPNKNEQSNFRENYNLNLATVKGVLFFVSIENWKEVKKRYSAIFSIHNWEICCMSLVYTYTTQITPPISVFWHFTLSLIGESRTVHITRVINF